MEREKAPKTIIQIFLRTILSFLILGIAVGVFIVLGTPESSKRHKGRFMETPTVETMQAEPHTTGIDFEVDGVVVPYREVVVSPEVSGRVVYKSSNCRQGRFVKKGECLFRIDPANYQLDVQRLEAALEQAKANIYECNVEIQNLAEQIVLAKDQVTIQQREVKRYESVHDPGVYSESEIDSARNSLLASRNSLQQLESQHRLKDASKKRLLTVSQSAQAQLNRAKLDLHRTEILAPLSGVVTSYNIEQDSYVQAGASTITIQDTSRLEIRCSLHMQQVAWLWQTPSVAESASLDLSQTTGVNDLSSQVQPSSLNAYRLPALPVTVTYHLDSSCWAWQGTLTSYDGSSVDENTRMMPCRVTVDNPLETEAAHVCNSRSQDKTAPPTLMTGMFVEVKIHSKPAIPLLKIQEAALIPGNQVWTATGGLLKKHQVKVAQIENGEVIIYAEGAGMSPGDQVVISSMGTPIEGMKVNLSPKENSSSLPTMAPVAADGHDETSRKF